MQIRPVWLSSDQKNPKYYTEQGDKGYEPLFSGTVAFIPSDQQDKAPDAND
jgi:hypothetical protein